MSSIRSHKRSRSQSISEDERSHRRSKKRSLPFSANEIDEHDFFLQANPFRVWLLEEKGKSFDAVSGEDARRYFDKFVKKWNRHKLDGKLCFCPLASADLYEYGTDKFYDPAIEAPSTSTHSWGIRRTEKESFDAERVKHAVSSSNRAVQGPSRPPVSASGSALADLTYRREEEQESRDADRKYEKAKRQREKADEREEVNSNRATGKDRVQEKRMEARASHSAFASRKEADNGLELDEDQLGLREGNDSFAAAKKARDQAQERRFGKKTAQMEEKQAMLQDRRSEYRRKEDSTSRSLKMQSDFSSQWLQWICSRQWRRRSMDLREMQSFVYNEAYFSCYMLY